MTTDAGGMRKPFAAAPECAPEAMTSRAPLPGGPARDGDAEKFFALSLDLLCVARVDGHFLRLSPAFEQTLGYKNGELLSRSFLEFVHPDDRARTLAETQKLAEGALSIRFENRYRCRDGTYKWLAWMSSPDPEQGLIYAVARDVTAQKAAEERIRRRELQLAEAQAIAGFGSWEWDLTSQVVTWSDELYRIWGLDRNDVQPSYEAYLAGVPSEERESVALSIGAAMDGGESYVVEHGVLRPSGELRVVRGLGRVVVDAEGRRVRVAGIAQDVTDQRRAEEQRELLELMSREIHGSDTVQSALQMTLNRLCVAQRWDYGEVWMPLEDGSALACSQAFYASSPELSEFRKQSASRLCERDRTLPGRVYASNRPEWHVDVSSVSDDVFCRATAARAAGLRTCVAVPLAADGVVMAVVVLLRNEQTTNDARDLGVVMSATAQLGALIRRKQAEEALRQSEERFQIAASATNDVIYDWDLRNDGLWLTDALERNFGHQGGTLAIAWWAELIHPADADRIGASLTAALEGKDQFWSSEYRFRCANGNYAFVFDRGYILRDASGKAIRMIGSMMDVSERTRAAEDLRQAKNAAEAGARAKSQFLANMSHEIRTPLTAVLGFADLLLDPKLSDSERLNYAMTIRRNGEHLLELLNDILDLSKIEAGKLVIEEIECSPARILTEVASLMRVRAIEKGLTFELRYETPVPAMIRSDPTRLRQIVLNLVNNAIKFTERGSVVIAARLDAADSDAPQFVVRVADTGIGMAPEQVERLFQPFSQADPSMTRRYGGTGLGLGICAPLATALGGVIAVSSETGRGSTFSLSLPIDAESAAGEMIAPSEALDGDVTVPAAVHGSLRLHGCVLLAEDGPDNQLLLASVLRKRGLDVTVVENGRLAVERVLAAWQAGRPYDLVLMDMQMPELDGYGATAQLRGKGYGGAIVALTAHAMAGERERCLAAGCDGYLTKPIDREQLVRAVSEYVHRARSTPPEPAPSLDAPRLQTRLATSDSPLVSVYAADPEMADIVTAFVDALPTHLTALREAAANAEWTAVQRSAHQLKGAAGGYGFPTITDAAARLEDAIRDQQDDEQRRHALGALLALCERTRPASPAAVLSRPARSAPSVLVIDDSLQIHQLIEARLRSESIVMHRAFDADEGFAMARLERPDLVLLDLDLPSASGLEVCRQLKAHPDTASIPVVFLTSTADVTTKAAALDLGAVDYVTKPFDGVELRARVRAVLRTKRYHDLLTTRAQLDGLTGLWNRAFFDARLREEFAACVRHRRALALVLLDIDHFKKLNDSFGHPFGDQVLQHVATALSSTVRTSDVVCRYGGEEFAVILRETGLGPATVTAERLRAALLGIRLRCKEQDVPVTASFGVAAIEPHADPSLAKPATLLAAADEALYAAKRNGRNRVTPART